MKSDDPQEILRRLIHESKLSSYRPEDILKEIHASQRPILNDLSIENNKNMELVGSHDYLVNPKEDINFSEEQFSQFVKEYEKDENFSALDYIDIPEVNLYEILETIASEENELFDIEFNVDQENIFELEELNPGHLDNILVQDDYVLEKDVPQKIRDTEKKHGSVKQKTINLKELFGTGYLRFNDEGEELFKILKNKLLIYWDCIINFDDVVCTDTFLRTGIGQLCRYLSINEIMERVDFINIIDDNYVKLIKEILPNAYIYWSTQKDVSIEKQDLIHELDADTKNHLVDNQLVSDESIGFFRKKSSLFSKTYEKKLRYPIYFVERVTNDVIQQYDIDKKVSDLLEVLINDNINWDEVLENNRLKESEFSNYKLQFNFDTFARLFKFVEKLLLDSCWSYLEDTKNKIANFKKEIKFISDSLPKKLLNKFSGNFQTVFLNDNQIENIPEAIRVKFRRLEELEFALMDEEHLFFIRQDILRNVFELIPFSMYNIKLDKIKLICYHYIIKFLHEKLTIRLEEFPEFFDGKAVRENYNPLEMFRLEIMTILQGDKVLESFIFTLREMIAKWVSQYNKLFYFSKYYYDMHMITPDIFMDRILRVIMFTTFKNKNPMTLRATFSTYLSIIHLIIYTEINSDFMRRKTGTFSMIDDQANRGNYNSQRYYEKKNSSKKYITPILKAVIEDNPKALNENYYLFKRLDLGGMLQSDSLTMLSSCPPEIAPHDWIFYWFYCFRHFSEPNYKINTNYLNKSKTSLWMNFYKFISLKTNEYLYDTLMDIVKDQDNVEMLLNTISEDISKKLSNNGYLDKKFNLIVKSNTEILQEVDLQLSQLKNALIKK